MKNNRDIKVSVVCTAYNHAKYIEKTLDGFVMQKTNFDFEVIVHDDASTDNTAEIIKEYANKYPNLIIPILQSENQYSKKIDILKTYIACHIKGKYMALCEGDDYWTDSYKLQAQYDALENNPNCGICVGLSRCCDEKGNLLDKTIPSKSCGFNETGIIKKDTIIKTLFSYNSYPFQTSSYFYRNTDELFLLFDKLIPFDRYLLLSIASIYDFFYINQEMSMYRMLSKNSWSSKKSANTFTKNSSALIFINNDFIFDRETDYKYHNLVISKACNDLSYTSKTHPKDTKKIIKDNKISFYDFVKNIGFIETLKVFFSIYFVNASMKFRHITK